MPAGSQRYVSHLDITNRSRVPSKSHECGVRELAPAFRAGSLLPAPGAPTSVLTQSGSKLPHSTNWSRRECPVFL